MSQSETVQKLRQLRMDRMRNGKMAGELVALPNDPEWRVALVPLTEMEYDQCLQASALIDLPDNSAGMTARDRREQCEVLFRAIRNPSDLTEQVFESADDIAQQLESTDINFLSDFYCEMIDRSSPSLDGFDEEELEEVKKVLANLRPKELSGRQWYALKRFLLTITPSQLLDKSPGSI